MLNVKLAIFDAPNHSIDLFIRVPVFICSVSLLPCSLNVIDATIAEKVILHV
jgi:hypothetical protein